MSDLQTRHDRDVARICEEVKQFHTDKKQFRIYHGSTGSTRPMSFKPGTYIDTSGLNRVFPVNRETMTVKVEPKVAMDELVTAVSKEGFLPQVVPELVSLTVGGCFAGTAGESSSYKYGLFEETISEIEIVLGDGTLTTASETFQPELLEGAGSTMGTLGIVTLCEVKLIPYRKYVEMTIERVYGINDAIEKIETFIEDPTNEYVDGMMFNKSFGVAMCGKLTDTPSKDAERRTFLQRSDPWFVNWVEDTANKKKDKPIRNIAVPIYDYFFRTDRGIFWGGELAFDYFHVPFNRITRWLLDPLMNSRTAYHALHEGGFASKYIVQDFGVPASKASDFVDFVTSVLPNYQFWFCPAKPGSELGVFRKLNTPKNNPDKLKLISDERIYNVGVYGKAPRDYDQFVKINRDLEHKLWHDFCGVKILYAHSYYTEEEFWDIYSKENYDLLRKMYRAEGLPSIYDKISSDMSSGKKPPKTLAGTRGALKAAAGMVSRKRRTGYLVKKDAPAPGSIGGAPATNGTNGTTEKKEPVANGMNGTAKHEPMANGAANGHANGHANGSATSQPNGVANGTMNGTGNSLANEGVHAQVTNGTA